MSLKVFVSYAREDEPKARECRDLFAALPGIVHWMDVVNLLPGQNWEAEIDRAFKDSHVVVILLSKASVTKRGFVTREANQAIENLRYKQPRDIYVIPMLLERCEVPEHISSRLQYVDLSVAGAWDSVKQSLELAAKQQSIDLVEGVTAGPFRFFTEKVEERCEGFPGSDTLIAFPRFESELKPNIARELSDYFSGLAITSLMNARVKPWQQMQEAFVESGLLKAANTHSEDFSLVHASETVLCLKSDISTYGAGAAHPQHYFKTYTFAVSDRLLLLNLEDFLNDDSSGLERISELCHKELEREYWRRAGHKAGESQIDWFRQGLEPKPENFRAFTVSDDRFTFLFPPYQVACYADGAWSVEVSFFDLLDVLRIDGPIRIKR